VSERILISIVLPVSNQGDHIEGVIRGYQEVLNNLLTPYELLIIVNASRDQSAEICRHLAAKNDHIREFEISQRGWGRAVKLGLRKARGSILCYTNSARTTPNDLALLLLYATIFPDSVIKANRKIRENWRRRLGSLLYNLECRTLFRLSQWDINGTPKVFSRQHEHLLALSSDDDLIDLEFNVVCRNSNYPLIEVPIFSTERHGGRSTTDLFSASKMYWGAFDMWRRMNQKPSHPEANE
jgi:glycosyltransferase involved in cell wall biosynthesis